VSIEPASSISNDQTRYWMSSLPRLLVYQELTDHDICLCTLFLEQIGGVIVALDGSYFGKFGGDLFSFLLCAYEGCVLVIWVLVVQFVQRVAANVAGSSRAVAVVSAVSSPVEGWVLYMNILTIAMNCYARMCR
jgi:hypothetical protein